MRKVLIDYYCAKFGIYFKSEKDEDYYIMYLQSDEVFVAHMYYKFKIKSIGYGYRKVIEFIESGRLEKIMKKYQEAELREPLQLFGT